MGSSIQGMRTVHLEADRKGLAPWQISHRWRAVTPVTVRAKDGTQAFYTEPLKRHGKPRKSYTLPEWEEWHIRKGIRVSYVIIHGADAGVHLRYTPKNKEQLPATWPGELARRIDTTIQAYDPEVMMDHYYLEDYNGLPATEISSPHESGYEYDPSEEPTFEHEFKDCECHICRDHNDSINMRVQGHSPTWTTEKFPRRAIDLGKFTPQANTAPQGQLAPQGPPTIRDEADTSEDEQAPPRKAPLATMAVAGVSLMLYNALYYIFFGGFKFVTSVVTLLLFIRFPTLRVACNGCRRRYKSLTRSAYNRRWDFVRALAATICVVLLGFIASWLMRRENVSAPAPSPPPPSPIAEAPSYLVSTYREAVRLYDRALILYLPEIRAILFLAATLVLMKTMHYIYKKVSEIIEYVEDLHTTIVLSSLRIVGLLSKKETYLAFMLVCATSGYLMPTVCYLAIESIDILIKLLSLLSVMAGIPPAIPAAFCTVFSLMPLLISRFYVLAGTCVELRSTKYKRVILVKGEHPVCLHKTSEGWTRPFTGKPHKLDFKNEARITSQAYRNLLKGELHYKGILALYKDVTEGGQIRRVPHGHCVALNVPSGDSAGHYLIVLRHLFERDDSAGWNPCINDADTVFMRRWNSSKGVMTDIAIRLASFEKATMKGYQFIASTKDFSVYKVPEFLPGSRKRYELFARLGVKALEIQEIVGLRGSCVIQAYQGDTVTVSRGEIIPASAYESKYGLVLHNANTEPGFSGAPIFTPSSTSATSAMRLAAIHLGTQDIGGTTYNVGLSASAIIHLLRKLGARTASPFTNIDVGFVPEASPGSKDNGQSDYSSDEDDEEYYENMYEVSDQEDNDREWDPDDYDERVPQEYRDDEDAVNNRDSEIYDEKREREGFNRDFGIMMDPNSGTTEAQAAAGRLWGGSGGQSLPPQTLSGRPTSGWGESSASPVPLIVPHARVMPGVDSDIGVSRYWRNEFDRTAGIVVRPLSEIRKDSICLPEGRLPPQAIFRLIIEKDSIDYFALFKQWAPEELFNHDSPIFARLRSYLEAGKIVWDDTPSSDMLGPKGEPVFQKIGKSVRIHCAGHDAYKVDDDFLRAAATAGQPLTDENMNPLFMRPYADSKTILRTIREQSKRMRKGDLDKAATKLRDNYAIFDGMPKKVKNKSYVSFADNIDECIAAFDGTKSNGFAAAYTPFTGPKEVCKTGAGKDALIEVALAILALQSSLGHKALGEMSPEELVTYGLSDPKAVFPKNENIPWAKASLGFCRTIWNVSTPHNFVTSLLSRTWAKKQISGYQDGTVTSLFTGVGHHPAGIERIGMQIDKNLYDPNAGGDGQGLVVKDCSSFDLTVRRDLMMVAAYSQIYHSGGVKGDATSEFNLTYRSKTDKFDPSSLEDYGVSQQFVDFVHMNALVRSAHVFVVDDELYGSCIGGIIASGDALTSSCGSEVQTIAHRLCGAQNTSSGSDDNISRMYGENNSDFDRPLYESFGFIVKFVTVTPRNGPLSFNSLSLQREEGQPWKATFENIPKLYVNARCHTPNQEAADSDSGRARWSSYKGILTKHASPGDWDVMVKTFAYVGIIIDPTIVATYDVSPTCTEWVDEPDFKPEVDLGLISKAEPLLVEHVLKRDRSVRFADEEDESKADKLREEYASMKEDIHKLQALVAASSKYQNIIPEASPKPAAKKAKAKKGYTPEEWASLPKEKQDEIKARQKALKEVKAEKKPDPKSD